jgi:hypothetical protein
MHRLETKTEKEWEMNCDKPCQQTKYMNINP